MYFTHVYIMLNKYSEHVSGTKLGQVILNTTRPTRNIAAKIKKYMANLLIPTQKEH